MIAVLATGCGKPVCSPKICLVCPWRCSRDAALHIFTMDRVTCAAAILRPRSRASSLCLILAKRLYQPDNSMHTGRRRPTSMILSRTMAPSRRKMNPLRRCRQSGSAHMVFCPAFLPRTITLRYQVRYCSPAPLLVIKDSVLLNFMPATYTFAIEVSVFATDSPASLGSHDGNMAIYGLDNATATTQRGNSVEEAIIISPTSDSSSLTGTYSMPADASSTNPDVRPDRRPRGPSGLKVPVLKKPSLEEYSRSWAAKRR